MRNNNKYKIYILLKLRKHIIVNYKYIFRMQKHEKQSRQ